ncbi:MAG: hypothetical protein ACREQY_14175 [Candidatus Binatia bacterium]
MAKRDRREARLRAGLDRLKALGLSRESASVADLEKALDERPEAALAVVELLGDRVSEESASILRRIEASAADKDLRREARRSIYRLAQKGLATPEAPPATPRPSPSLFAEEEPEGYLSPQDPSGDRLFWILKPRAGGGVHHLSTVVNEPEGLKEAVLAEVSRKAIRGLRADLERRHGLRMIEVDWRYCDSIAAEGYERARGRGALGEDAAAWPQLRMQLFRKPAEPVRPPIDAILEPGSGPDERSLDSSAELFAGADFQHWFLPEAVLGPYLERYATIRDSPILLDRQQQVGRIEEIIGDALREIFSGEEATSWRRRLDEAAYVLWKAGHEDAARRARAASLALAASGSGAKGIPFFEELTRRSFGLHFAREAEKEREERASSVILTPDQIREESARAEPRPPVRPRRR